VTCSKNTPIAIHLKSDSGRVSVSARVQKEDVYSHPDIEFWIYTHC